MRTRGSGEQCLWGSQQTALGSFALLVCDAGIVTAMVDVCTVSSWKPGRPVRAFPPFVNQPLALALCLCFGSRGTLTVLITPETSGADCDQSLQCVSRNCCQNARAAFQRPRDVFFPQHKTVF